MTANAVAGGDDTTIDLPGSSNPFLIALISVSVALLPTIGLLITSTALPLAMVALLVVVAGSALFLAVIATDQMLGSKLTVTDDGVTLSRMLGAQTFAWHQIEDVKVVAPTNSLGDDPMIDVTRRLGLGLFIRVPGRPPDTTRDAEVILCTAKESRLEMLVQLVERLKRMRPKSGARPGVSQAPPRIGAKRGEFRQKGGRTATVAAQ